MSETKGITAQVRAYLDLNLRVRDSGWTADNELRLTDLLDAVDAVHAGALAALDESHDGLERARRERDSMAAELERVTAEAESLRKAGEMSAAAALGFKDDAERLRNALNEAYEFQGRLEACAEEREDVTLWGVDYMPLPLDADGKAVHVGDTMVDYDTPRPVCAVSASDICMAGYSDGSYYRMGIAKNYHHHAHTVEDVLREMMAEMGEVYAEDVLLAKYAPRLRLAGDEND